MKNILTDSDKRLLIAIGEKVAPGVTGIEERINEVLFGFAPPVRSAWLFYLRHFSDKILKMSEKNLKKEAYKSPFKEFLLPIRYAAFSDMLEENESPLNVKKERWHQQIIDASYVPSNLDCEFVVVGSGAGGATVANRLAALGYAVIIVEEGNYYGRQQITGNPADAFRKLYRNSGFTFAWGKSPFPVWAGKAVGGTTLINSGTCVRNPDYILDEWVNEYHVKNFNKDFISQYYYEVESILDVTKVKEPYIGGVGNLIKDAAQLLNWKHGSLPRNAVGCDGQARCCFGCPTEAKTSTNVSFVPRALLNGAQIVVNAKVLSVDMHNNKATGVFVKSPNGMFRINATNGVIISGGALMTPQLLNASGIDNKNIGSNLSVHPALAIFALHDIPVNMTTCSVPQGYHISEFLPDFMLEGASMVPPVAAMALKSVGKEFTHLMNNYDKLSMFGAMIKDSSRGRVLKDGHVLYSCNRSDVKKIRRAAQRLVQLLEHTRRVKEVYPFVNGVHKIGHSRKKWWDVFADDMVAKYNKLGNLHQKDITLSAYHPLGTCRMGDDPATSVVNDGFEVWRTENLYVVDGSLFPSSTGHNPQLTIMSLGLMAGDFIDAAQ